MTIYHVDILWGLMLLGVGLFTTCVLVFNPVLHSMRVMGIGAAYALGVRMLIVLLRGVVLWPTMIPEAIEGMLIDLGVLSPSATAESGIKTTES